MSFGDLEIVYGEFFYFLGKIDFHGMIFSWTFDFFLNFRRKLLKYALKNPFFVSKFFSNLPENSFTDLKNQIP